MGSAFLLWSARAQEPYAAIPAALQPFATDGQMAGSVMLVADRRRIIHRSAVGLSNLSTGRKMTPQDFFWIASMTKPMTAVALGTLVDTGTVGWNDPVEKYLPEFKRQWVIESQSGRRKTLVRAARPITLADLLTHTSGLGEYAVTDPHWTLAEFTAIVAREPLRFQPGAQWAYSTAGIDVLGRVIEVVSGRSFADFMQEKLFGPLRMNHSAFWLTAQQEDSRAECYSQAAGNGRLEPTRIPYLYGGAVTDVRRPALGGAGLFSTAEDVARFYQMMLGDGELDGNRILRPVTVRTMTSPHTGALATRPGMSWGFGFSILADPGQSKSTATLSRGTFGHGGAFGTQSWADPNKGLIYVLMLEREKLAPSPDDSPMRRAFQQAAAGAN